jgi:hypothetical protein
MSEDKLTIPEVMPMVEEYFREAGESGGDLHIVLEERCVDDDSVEFCRDAALKGRNVTGYVLAVLLLRMSKTQRRKISGLWSKMTLEAEASA